MCEAATELDTGDMLFGMARQVVLACKGESDEKPAVVRVKRQCDTRSVYAFRMGTGGYHEGFRRGIQCGNLTMGNCEVPDRVRRGNAGDHYGWCTWRAKGKIKGRLISVFPSMWEDRSI